MGYFYLIVKAEMGDVLRIVVVGAGGVGKCF